MADLDQAKALSTLLSYKGGPPTSAQGAAWLRLVALGKAPAVDLAELGAGWSSAVAAFHPATALALPRYAARLALLAGWSAGVGATDLEAAGAYGELVAAKLALPVPLDRKKWPENVRDPRTGQAWSWRVLAPALGPVGALGALLGPDGLPDPSLLAMDAAATRADIEEKVAAIKAAAENFAGGVSEKVKLAIGAAVAVGGVVLVSAVWRAFRR